MKNYKKIKLKDVSLGTYPVYIKSVYNGKEPFKVVGIREKQVELKGDYSGVGMDNSSIWFDKKDCFMIQSVCPETLKPNGCQIHNLFCCGGGDVILGSHVKYWE